MVAQARHGLRRESTSRLGWRLLVEPMFEFFQPLFQGCVAHSALHVQLDPTLDRDAQGENDPGEAKGERPSDDVCGCHKAIGGGEMMLGLQQFHLLRVVHLALDLVGDRFADTALHFKLGGCAVENGDPQADGELAVFVGGVLRFAPVGGEQFAGVFEGLILEGLVCVHGGVGWFSWNRVRG